MRRVFAAALPGVLQGAYSYVLQDDDGQIALTHSVSAGLDYAMIGPEHAWLHDQQPRRIYCGLATREALDAARLLSRTEGIIPALESAHAVAEAVRRAPAAPGQIFMVNVSGRGDKDIDIYRENLKELGPGNDAASAGLFERLKRDGRKGLIAYLTAGDPSPERTPALVEALERGGADLIELGVPFSDPIADGPVIQRGRRARARGRHHAAQGAGDRRARSASAPRFRCCCSLI